MSSCHVHMIYPPDEEPLMSGQVLALSGRRAIADLAQKAQYPGSVPACMAHLFSLTDAPMIRFAFIATPTRDLTITALLR